MIFSNVGNASSRYARVFDGVITAADIKVCIREKVLPTLASLFCLALSESCLARCTHFFPQICRVILALPYRTLTCPHSLAAFSRPTRLGVFPSFLPATFSAAFWHRRQRRWPFTVRRASERANGDITPASSFAQGALRLSF